LSKQHPKGENPPGFKIKVRSLESKPKGVLTPLGLDYSEEKEKGLKKKKRKFDSCLGQRQLKKIRHALRIAKQF